MSRRSLLQSSLAFSAGLLASTILPAGVSAATLQEIRRRGRLVVAVKDNLRPLAFRGASGELEGLEIDLAKRLAQDLFDDPESVQLQPVSNAERISKLVSADVDVAIARLTITRSRARQVTFSPPYYLDGTVLVTQDPAITALSEIRRQAIAVLNNSSTVPVVRSRFPQATLVPVTSYQVAKHLLDAGEAIAFAADASVLTGWVQMFPEYRLLPGFLSTEALAIALPTGLRFDDLRTVVNRSMENWRQSGWLQERVRHWGLPV